MLIVDAINKVAGKVPGCSELEIVSAYRYALIDFCIRTRCMTSWVTTTTNDLISPVITSDQQTVDILDALLDDQEIACAYMNDRAVTAATHEAPVLTWSNPNVPQVVPQPLVSKDLQLLLVFAPGPTATEIEDTIWMRYGEAIDHGALARLLLEPGRPYSNPQVGAFHGQQFDDAITKAAALLGSRVRTVARRLRVTPAP